MEYWVSQNGKKQGPLKEWDIRAMIEEEKLSKEDLVWHADLPAWTKLEEYSAMQSYFEKKPELSKEDQEIEEAKEKLKQKIEAVTGERIPDSAIIKVEKIESHYWVRRGFAKMFDLTLYYFLFFVVANFAGMPVFIDPELNWVRLICLIPFFVIEGFLLYLWGVTPGKWILGLRVTSLAGLPPLDYNRSILRSAASWFLGMIMGMFPFCIIAMILSYYSTKKRGITSWDALGRTKVESYRPAGGLAIFNYILLSLSIIALNYGFIFSHRPTTERMGNIMLEQLHALEKKSPEMKPHIERFEKQIRTVYNISEPTDPS